MMTCKNCDTPTNNPTFCSRSCSVAWNNREKPKRQRAPLPPCEVCGKPVKTSQRKFCSQVCSSSRHKRTKEQINRSNAARQSKYRAKKLRVMSPDADPKKIKMIYENCPEGHEVDHIIPLSKGGLHHEDNLQYLPKLVNRKKGNRVVEVLGLKPSL